jgi:hypothetical protein
MNAMAGLTENQTRYNIENIVSSGDMVAVRITDQRVIKSEFQLVGSDEQRRERELESGITIVDEVRGSALAMFLIRDGKITAQWLEGNHPPVGALSPKSEGV